MKIIRQGETEEGVETRFKYYLKWDRSAQVEIPSFVNRYPDDLILSLEQAQELKKALNARDDI